MTTYFLAWKLDGAAGETVMQALQRVPDAGLVLAPTCRAANGELATDLSAAFDEARARLEPSGQEVLLVQPVYGRRQRRRAKRFHDAHQINSKLFARWLRRGAGVQK